MGSIADGRGQRNEAMNLKTGQQELANLNNRKKTEPKPQSLRELWDYNVISNIHDKNS